MHKETRGVYFLASDGTLDLARAFLNSFRAHNPDLPLCLVPFDDCYSEIAELREKYLFSILENREDFRFCDAISRKFHHEVRGEYRKLSMWNGIFQEFVYIDLDTVILANVEFVFSFLEEYDFITSHSDMPENRDMVWKPSIWESGRLSSRQIEYAANTGFIASRRGLLTLAKVGSRMPEALQLREHMELHCKEQPLLNYLIVTSGRTFTSLFCLAYRCGRRSPGIRQELWAGISGWEVRGGQLIKRGRQHHQLLMVHWAGIWRPGPLEDRVNGFLVRLGLMAKKPQVGRFIPYRKLWAYYRDLQ